MARIWNGQDLDLGPPALGLTLPLASLIPSFAAQFLNSGLCVDTDRLLITPLDDLKEWMRSHPSELSELGKRVREVLLALEQEGRADFASRGEHFDLAGYEIGWMEADESYERFDPDWAAMLLELCLEQADELADWAQRDRGGRFSLNISFSLPPAPGSKTECSGAMELELLPRGGSRTYPRLAETAFVRVPLEAPRAGDRTDASFCFLYPRAQEEYFLKTLDRARRMLSLQEEP